MPKETFSEGLMTESTRQMLVQKAADLERKIKENEKKQGETYESAQDWHDNGALDMLVQDLQLLVTQHDTILKRLRDAKIIQPRTETSTVGLGNTVVVRYAGEKDTEKFTVLGVADNDPKKNWVSAGSPLGSGLLDRKAGDKIQLPGNIQVTIIQILAGEF